MPEYRLPSLADFEHAEHCVLEDVTAQVPELAGDFLIGGPEPSEVREELRLHDKLRGRKTTIRLYAEGWADIEVERRGRSASCKRFNLSYLDPVPEVSRHYPVRLLKTGGALAALTGVAAVPALLDVLAAYTMPAMLVLLAATIASLGVGYYLSHEKIVFRTRHGRARAMHFGVGLGTITRFRRRLPRIVKAIGEAARFADEDTHAFLRSEMREHYRLRNDGVLSEDECSDSTGRILCNFDEAP